MSQPEERSPLPEIAHNLPSLPTVALEVLRVCDDPHAEIGELASILGRDPSLSAKVLQMANSAFYNRGGEVTSLQRASLMLGLRSLKVLSLGFSLASELPQSGSAGGLDLGAYWHRSTMHAVVARSLSVAVGFTGAEEAFLCGLLSDIGKLALAHGVPGEYAKVVSRAGWPSEADELAVLGYTSVDVGERVLRQWGVPEMIVLGACYGDRLDALPPGTTPETTALARVVGLSRVAASVFFDDDASGRLAAFSIGALRMYGITSQRVDDLLSRLQGDLEEAAAVLSLRLPEGISYDALVTRARMQMMTVSMDVVHDLAQTSQTLDHLERQNRELEAQARTDRLTGLANRRALEEFLVRTVNQRQRGVLPEWLGVLMIDIDRFKQLNDTYGHQVGDEVLRGVSSAMHAVVRESELLARYGGEEFCLVLPQSTPGALAVAAERLRAAVEMADFSAGNGPVRVTVSLGGACLGTVTSATDGERLIAVADRKLYEAKDAGRNRFAIEPQLV